MPLSSAQSRTGRYKHGGTTDVTNPRALKWWERRVFSPAVDDITFKITATYISRPDLIAFEVYGRSILAWIVLQYNNIVDINEEIVEGRIIKLPSLTRVQTEILTKSS